MQQFTGERVENNIDSMSLGRCKDARLETCISRIEDMIWRNRVVRDKMINFLLAAHGTENLLNVSNLSNDMISFAVPYLCSDHLGNLERGKAHPATSRVNEDSLHKSLASPRVECIVGILRPGSS